MMEPTLKGAAASDASISTHSTSSSDYSDINLSPFVARNGRRYLRNSAYPLPVDLQELNRQNLHTLLTQQVFGKPLCHQISSKSPPKSVLEIACGTGFWSAACHDWLSQHGCSNVSFTGLDIVHLAPDLRAQGMNWRFVQHDIKRVPFPFQDESFDLIIMKDLSLVLQPGQASQEQMDEAIRLLRPGGVLEIWETDHVVRSIMPHALSPPSSPEAFQQALTTATFEISSATPFGSVTSRFLQNFNDWMETLLDRRKLSALPCSRMQPSLLQEPDDLCDIGSRRVAIPLGEMEWERNSPRLLAARQQARLAARGATIASQFESDSEDESVLTSEQAAIRAAALSVFVQLIESMEPLLRGVSGKNGEEWQRWWNWMVMDLFQDGTSTSGCCLEIGAFWARKRLPKE